ncbi:hypothetical protein ACMFMG_004668 [Clarireedia jacksonii]
MAWNRCFTELTKRFVAHSAASRVLVDNPMARSGLDFILKSTGKLLLTSGLEPLHRTDKSLFEYYADHPKMGRRTAEAMICFSNAVSESSQASYLVKNYPWNNIANGSGSGIFVDVGGAQGHTSIELAQASGPDQERLE